MMTTKMMMIDLAGHLHFVIILCIHMNLVAGLDYNALYNIPTLCPDHNLQPPLFVRPGTVDYLKKVR